MKNVYLSSFNLVSGNVFCLKSQVLTKIFMWCSHFTISFDFIISRLYTSDYIEYQNPTASDPFVASLWFGVYAKYTWPLVSMCPYNTVQTWLVPTHVLSEKHNHSNPMSIEAVRNSPSLINTKIPCLALLT